MGQVSDARTCFVKQKSQTLDTFNISDLVKKSQSFHLVQRIGETRRSALDLD